jgi:streptogramin lyase
MKREERAYRQLVRRDGLRWVWLAVVLALGHPPAAWGASGPFAEFPVPTAGGVPNGITAGPDGNLWFTELNADKIGRITPAGEIVEFPLPTTNSQTLGITAGPDGNLWFAESARNQIGRITPAGQLV